MKILQFCCVYPWHDWNQLKFGVVKNERTFYLFKNERIFYLTGKDRTPWNFTYRPHDLKYTLIYNSKE